MRTTQSWWNMCDMCLKLLYHLVYGFNHWKILILHHVFKSWLMYCPDIPYDFKTFPSTTGTMVPWFYDSAIMIRWWFTFFKSFLYLINNIFIMLWFVPDFVTLSDLLATSRNVLQTRMVQLMALTQYMCTHSYGHNAVRSRARILAWASTLQLFAVRGHT